MSFGIDVFHSHLNHQMVYLHEHNLCMNDALALALVSMFLDYHPTSLNYP